MILPFVFLVTSGQLHLLGLSGEWRGEIVTVPMEDCEAGSVEMSDAIRFFT